MPRLLEMDPPCRLMVANSTIITETWQGSLRDPYWRLYGNEVDGAAIVYPGGRHRLDPEHLHLVPPWGAFRSACQGSVRHDYIHVDAGDWAMGCFTRPVALAVAADVRERFRRLARGEAWSPVGRLRARALALDCLASAYEQLPAARRREAEAIASDDPLERARRYIAEHLAAPLRLSGIAARVGLSPQHLNQRFRARFDQSCMAYVRERRIAAATERLLLGDASIETIADDLGFANRYHFSRLFSRITGVGPAAYRQQHRR